MKKIPCIKCGGKLSHMFGVRIECVDCGIQYQLKITKKLKRKLEKKCVTCGNKFKDTQSGVLNCSKNCSVKYRKKIAIRFRIKYKKNKRKKNGKIR